MKKFFKGTLWTLLGVLVAGLGLLIVSFIAVRNADADVVRYFRCLPDDLKTELLKTSEEPRQERRKESMEITLADGDGKGLSEEEIKAQIAAQMPPPPAVPPVQWSQAELPADVAVQMAEYPFDLNEFGEMREDVSLCAYTPPAVDDWLDLLPLFVQHEKEMLPPDRFPDEEREGESIVASYKLWELKLWKNAEGGDVILRATLRGNAGYRPLPDRVFFYVGHAETRLLSPMPHWWIQNLSPIFVR